MSPLEKRLHERLARRLREQQPAMERQVLRAWEAISAQLSQAELTRLLSSSSIDFIISELLSEKVLDRALAGVRVQIRLQVDRSVTWASKELPRRANAAAGLGIQFNVLNPKHVQAIRDLNTRVIGVMKADVRESFRAFVENGLRDGVNPRTIARQVKDWIGLSGNQTSAVSNFRKMLETGDLEALTRKLRDRRFDGTLKRLLGTGGEGLTTAQIDSMTNAYLRKMVTHNAETLSRTAVLESMKIGNKLAWQDAVDQGFIEPGRLMKRWSTVLDGRERPEHHEMNGDVTTFDGLYRNQDSYAGEQDPYNCRCLDVFFQSREAA